MCAVVEAIWLIGQRSRIALACCLRVEILSEAESNAKTDEVDSFEGGKRADRLKGRRSRSGASICMKAHNMMEKASQRTLVATSASTSPISMPFILFTWTLGISRLETILLA